MSDRSCPSDPREGASSCFASALPRSSGGRPAQPDASARISAPRSAPARGARLASSVTERGRSGARPATAGSHPLYMPRETCANEPPVTGGGAPVGSPPTPHMSRETSSSELPANVGSRRRILLVPGRPKHRTSDLIPAFASDRPRCTSPRAICSRAGAPRLAPTPSDAARGRTSPHHRLRVQGAFRVLAPRRAPALRPENSRCPARMCSLGREFRLLRPLRVHCRDP